MPCDRCEANRELRIDAEIFKREAQKERDSERTRAEAAESEVARLREVVQTYVDRYGYSSDGNLRPSFRGLLAALAGTPSVHADEMPAPECRDGWHTAKPGARACLCGENRMERLL